MKNSIVIFTHSFPFGKGEAFLESEVFYLAERFNRVFLVPSIPINPEKGHRQIPANVEVITDLYPLSNRPLPKIFLINVGKVLSVYIWTLFRRDNFKVYLPFYKSFVHYLLSDLNKYNTIYRIIKQRKLQDAIFYDYWFVNSTVSLSILRRKNIINSFICRAHRFDLYDECNFETRVSFRDFKIRHLDHIYTISSHGRDYLKSKIATKFHHKVKLSYLGVDKLVVEDSLTADANNSGTVVVSCSRMIPSKRVEVIPEVLSKIKHPVKWVHFGDGPMFDQVKDNADKFLPGEFILKGNIENQSIHQYYANSKVDLFISLSQSEGLPVSMMEAIAYGVPIFSTEAGGVKDLVGATVGVTIPIDSSIDFIAQELTDMIQNISSFDRDEIMKVYKSRFSASRNYRKFIDEIKQQD